MDHEMEMLSEFIQTNFGINLTEKRILLEGRLTNLLEERGFENFESYFHTVLADKTERELILLIDKITTNHTFFMRETSHFDYFRDTVLPWLAETVTDGDLRIWCAGCSTGEEPYTLAMILADYFEKNNKNWDTKILATDISNRALSIAKKGVYNVESIKILPSAWQLSYFKHVKLDQYEVCERIKNRVVFRSFNLMEKVLPFRKSFHVVFCRNVMIYFNKETKEQLVNRFYDNTEKGGYLFIGCSESIPKDALSYQYVMPSVYRKRL
jgi:chemotaxis protein methyltransferase CheR